MSANVSSWPNGLASFSWTVSLSPTCPFLELARADIADISMSTLAIVEAFDVVEHICSGLLPGLVFLSSRTFSLERGEERLDHCVVVETTSTTHAAGDTVLFE